MGKKVDSSLEERRQTLHDVIQFIQTATDVQSLNLSGGEFFSGELLSLEDEWLRMLDLCHRLNYKTIIHSHLCFKEFPELLKKTLEYDNVYINTSWDVKNRFSMYYNEWLQHSQQIADMKRLVVTLTLSASNLPHILEMPIKNAPAIYNPPVLRTDILAKTVTNTIFEQQYHDLKIKHIDQMPLDFFPKRNDVLKVLYELDSRALTENLGHLDVRSDVNVKFVKGSQKYDFLERFNNTKPTRCWHKVYFSCYLDSDACIGCDAEKILAVR